MQHNPECPACRARNQAEKDEHLGRLKVKVEFMEHRFGLNEKAFHQTDSDLRKKLCQTELKSDQIERRLSKVEEEQKDPWPVRWLSLFAVIAAMAALILHVPEANAQSRGLTGRDILQSYNAGGVNRDSAAMYITGVVDGMGMAGAICVPQDKPKGDYVQQVVYNLGANEQLHERRFDIAVSSAAVMAYPCGEAS